MIKKVFPPLALAIFSVMLGAGLIIPLLPLYAHSLGANITWLGIISASFFVASVTQLLCLDASPTVRGVRYSSPLAFFVTVSSL